VVVERTFAASPARWSQLSYDLSITGISSPS